MSRPLRIEYPGAFYHVINRGVERRRIFAEPQDFRHFLHLFLELDPRHRVNLLCYCLMPNHYHLFLNTPRGALHRFMQDLNSRYAQYYNKRCRRVGPVFQGRYKAVLVDKDTYALAISRYIHLNAVKAGLVDRPEEYSWSSYGAYVGRSGTRKEVKTGWLLRQFGREGRRSRELLRRFTLEGMEEEEGSAGLQTAGAIGEESFLRWVKREKVPTGQGAEIVGLRELQKPPRVVKEAMAKRVRDITRDEGVGRKLLIYGLRQGTSLTEAEIARLVGARSRHGVAQTVSRLTRQRREDAGLDALLKRLEAVCRK